MINPKMLTNPKQAAYALSANSSIGQPDRNKQIKMEGKSLTIAHFGMELDIPSTAKVQEYASLKMKKDKKNKTKYTKFTYYKTKDGKISKVLFRNNDSFVSQGEYPFVAASGKICPARDLSDLNPERLTISEAAYIGHADNKMFLKKMKDIPVQAGKIEINDAKDDLYETLPMGNQQRFDQFMKLITVNLKNSEMSIRVIIDETNPQKPEILDYQFFFREDEMKQNKKIFTE